jgi:endonuclease YncB( thermonuclease family)
MHPFCCLQSRGQSPGEKAVIRRGGCLVLGLVLALAWVESTQAAKGPPQATPPPSGTGAAGPVDSADARLWGTVRAVRDGTSLVVATPELPQYDVRLLGIELPEPPRPEGNSTPASPGQPFGPQAAAYVRDLLLDKQVRLDVYGKDRSGRALAVVWLGDIDVNLTLVKEGLAWVSPSLTVPNVRIGLEVAERQAQVGKYGLWALPDPEPPWMFRKRHRLPGE